MPKDPKSESLEALESPYGERIIPVNIAAEMKKSFIEYSMSVITMRALPDIRDGLKPVHRRILYAMHGLGLGPSAKFSKSAKIVGEVMGKYHPHGDASVYDAMVKMAQEFSLRYPLVWGQGNFGSVDGDNAAAPRYTEARMAKLSEDLLRDIEKQTVDFRMNYDNTLKEPTVLPTRVPSLLLNGVLGIAVGMATNIPPHNLGEVVDALIHLIENPQATVVDLLEFIKGPDFPLPCNAYNQQDIITAYTTGRGGVTVRALTEIEEYKPGRFQIVISSVPYQVNRANLIVKIVNLHKDKKLKGIKDLRDESTDVTRIVVELKSDANPQKVLNFLYKHTDLETNFNFNMTALVEGVPRLVSLKDILSHFVRHREEVVRRRSEFEKAKAEARAHVLEGLKKALDHIDEIIALIKKSKDTAEARENLMKKFKFSEIQATAILEMRLQKLAGLERKKIEDELKDKLDLIAGLTALLASSKKILKVVSKELLEMKDRYGDERRTRIIKSPVGEFSEEDLIEDKPAVLVFTASGYIKRTDISEYKKQSRGGKGTIGMTTREEDVVTDVLMAKTHDDLLCFTDAGKVYRTKVYEVAEGKRSSKGKSIKNYVGIPGEEKVQSLVALSKDTKKEEGNSLFFATRNGVVKRVDLAQFMNIRANGLIAIDLKDGDELLSVKVVSEKDHAMLVSRDGQSIRFDVNEVRMMGRNAAGVRGINLKKEDLVVSLCVISEDESEKVLVVSEHGYAKKTDVAEYKSQSRGGSGIKTLNVTDKTGVIVEARIVSDSLSDIIVMSAESQVIRVSLDEVSTLGRSTQGIRLMKFKKAGDRVASIALIQDSKDE